MSYQNSHTFHFWPRNVYYPLLSGLTTALHEKHESINFSVINLLLNALPVEGVLFSTQHRFQSAARGLSQVNLPKGGVDRPQQVFSEKPGNFNLPRQLTDNNAESLVFNRRASGAGVKETRQWGESKTRREKRPKWASGSKATANLASCLEIITRKLVFLNLSDSLT